MDRSISKLMVEIPADRELSALSYPIYTGYDILSMIGPIASELKLHKRVIIITDRNVEQLYSSHVHSSLTNFGYYPEIVSIESGEEQKKLGTVREIYDRMHGAGCGRDTTIFAVGGGVVGDLAGFVAATYHRGLPFVQVPTTLLAQVDSSVGGKVGVNLPYGKNLVGAFYQPRMVFIDTKTLTTLPGRELRSGLAEVIKYGAILDEELFNTVSNNLDTLIKPDLGVYPDVIERCCALKASVVQQDERESGYREILNFGHTVGHAIEAVTNYSVLTHGEAICYGMIAEAHISVNHCGLPEDHVNRLSSLLLHLSPTPIPDYISDEQIYSAMYSDKKVRSGKLRFSLINSIGNATFGEVPDERIIKQSLQYLFTADRNI